MRIASPREMGGFLRQARLAAGLSQTALGARLRASQKWVSSVENGKASVEMGMVLRLLAALNLELHVAEAAVQPQAPDDVSEVLRRLRDTA